MCMYVCMCMCVCVDNCDNTPLRPLFNALMTVSNYFCCAMMTLTILITGSVQVCMCVYVCVCVCVCMCVCVAWMCLVMQWELAAL